LAAKSTSAARTSRLRRREEPPAASVVGTFFVTRKGYTVARLGGAEVLDPKYLKT
jgi:hypothetical protein